MFLLGIIQIKYAKDLSFTFKSVRQKDMDIVDAFKRNEHNRRFVFNKEEVEKFIYEFEAWKTEQFKKKNPDAKPFKFATGGKNANPNKPEGQRQAIIDAGGLIPYTRLRLLSIKGKKKKGRA